MQARPWVIIAVFLVLGTWLFFYFHFNTVASSAQGPSHIHTSGQGDVYLLVDNQLFHFTSDGKPVAQYDLGRLGMRQMLGDFGIFANGDILLRLGKDEPGMLEKLTIFMRLRNRTPSMPAGLGEGLYRCDMKKFRCRPFGKGDVDFNRVFHVYISAQTEEVFIADTSRFQVRWFNKAGQLQGERITGFKFPNQLMQLGNMLYIANTNRHVIHKCRLDGRYFCQPAGNIDVVPGEARSRRETWPASFARVGKRWWVINMKKTMSNGGVYIFDDNWQYVKRLELPPSADPFELAVSGDSVLVTDNHNFRIYSFSKAGEPAGLFTSPQLQALLDRLGHTRAKYRGYAGSSILMMTGALALILTVAVLQERRRTSRIDTVLRGDVEDAAEKPLYEIPEGGKVWLLPSRKIRRLFKTGMFAVSLLPLLVIALMIMMGWRQELLVLLIVMLLIMVPIMMLFAWNLRMRIGTDGKELFLQDFRGKTVQGHGEEIVYSSNAILIDGVMVNLGNARHPVFTRERFEGYIRPLLEQGQKVSSWEMTRRLIALRNPFTMTSLALLVISVASIVVLGSISPRALV